MERELWNALYQLARGLDKLRTKGLFRVSYVLAVYFWAVVHDRPVSWACQRENWPADEPLVERRLPSQSTMSRRLRTTAAEQLMLAIEQEISEAAWSYIVWVKVIDAKPLPVGSYSKDPDAAWGRGAGRLQKGYKFYAIWEQRCLPTAWGLAPMNVAETKIGEQLMSDLPGSGYLLADKRYDSNKLFDVAAKNNHQLVAPRQNPGKALGHCWQSPYRLRSIALLRRRFGKTLYRERTQIERSFGNWTAFGSGLAPLPAWVRRFHRVRLWIHTKLLINALRIQHLHPEKMQAVA
jgi:transposase